MEQKEVLVSAKEMFSLKTTIGRKTKLKIHRALRSTGISTPKSLCVSGAKKWVGCRNLSELIARDMTIIFIGMYTTLP